MKKQTSAELKEIEDFERILPTDRVKRIRSLMFANENMKVIDGKVFKPANAPSYEEAIQPIDGFGDKNIPYDYRYDVNIENRKEIVIETELNYLYVK